MVRKRLSSASSYRWAGREAGEHENPRSEEEQMELTQAFEDQEVRQLLSGGEEDLALAFTRIEAHLRGRFVKGARDRLRGRIGSEDLADAWQESVRDLLKAVRARDIDPERELGPRLWGLFIHRVFDGLRRRSRFEGVLEQVKGRLSGTTTGEILERMDDEERRHLLCHVRQAVGDLPCRQRTVIDTFVEHFPATEDMDVLQRHVSQVIGVDVTKAAVKRALQEARRKVGLALKMRRP
jgi:hypothetical protein